MSKDASAIVLAGNGTNCEMETAYACRISGFKKVDIVTIWELIAGEKTLQDYDFMCLPGGFWTATTLARPRHRPTASSTAR